MQANLRADLSCLRAYVKEECWEKVAEVAQLVENVNALVTELQSRMVAEKEEALQQARREAESLESKFLSRMEIECQKLNDAETQIANYEEHLRQSLANLEELKHDKDMLSNEVLSKSEVIKNMMLEHELELDALRNQAKLEREQQMLEIKNKLEERDAEVVTLTDQRATLEERLRIVCEERDSLSSDLSQKESSILEILNDRTRLEEDLKQLRECKESEKANGKLESVQMELEKCKDEFLAQLREAEERRTRELKELEERLAGRHRSEMESLRSRYKLAVSTTTTSAMEKSTSVDHLESEAVWGPEDLERIVAENRERWRVEKEEEVREAVAKESARWHKEKLQLAASMRRERDELLEKSKARLVAELQVSFNEAINSVTREKDSAIERLRSKVLALESNLLSIKCEMEKHCGSDVTGEDAALLSRSDSGASGCKEDETGLFQRLKADIEPYLQVSDMVLSSSSQDGSDFLNKVKASSSQSRIAPCIDCTYKISILTTHIGDLILFCYEEKYDSFVAFHFGQYLYFLHSDSLEDLGLHIPAGPTEKWALGVIIDKEFCIARKPSNRYKMNVGTKFYRLKVRPWNREKAIEDYNLYRNSQSAACSSTRGDQSLCRGGMSASSI